MSLSTRVFDLQVNGFHGFGFSDDKLTIDKIHQITTALNRDWEYHFLATMITSPVSVIEQNLILIAEAMKQPPSLGKLRGIHLEGPFISKEEGPLGAHPRQDVISPNYLLFKKWMAISDNQIKIITLAPEITGAIEFIEQVKKNFPQVIVSLGHHHASHEIIKKAIFSGARMCTHLGNGIGLNIPRHPNPIWDQLSDGRLLATIIVDGLHLPESVIKVIIKTKGPDNCVFVSDVFNFAGCKPGLYDYRGEKIILNENAEIRRVSSGGFFGSAKNLVQCAEFIRSLRICSDEDIEKMIWWTPLKLLGVY